MTTMLRGLEQRIEPEASGNRAHQAGSLVGLTSLLCSVPSKPCVSTLASSITNRPYALHSSYLRCQSAARLNFSKPNYTAPRSCSTGRAKLAQRWQYALAYEDV